MSLTGHLQGNSLNSPLAESHGRDGLHSPLAEGHGRDSLHSPLAESHGRDSLNSPLAESLGRDTGTSESLSGRGNVTHNDKFDGTAVPTISAYESGKSQVSPDRRESNDVFASKAEVE